LAWLGLATSDNTGSTPQLNSSGEGFSLATLRGVDAFAYVMPHFLISPLLALIRINPYI